jgi:hypothetical protein
VVPVCLLYVTTRELYGVSIYHALVDVFQYSVVGVPEMGDAAKDALYRLETVHPFAWEAIGWVNQVAGIFITLGLCWIVKRWVLPSVTQPGFAGSEGEG